MRPSCIASRSWSSSVAVHGGDHSMPSGRAESEPDTGDGRDDGAPSGRSGAARCGDAAAAATLASRACRLRTSCATASAASSTVANEPSERAPLPPAPS